MKEDVVLKSVLFGGFDKKEVLEFIGKIQSEHFDESETIKQKDVEIEAVKAKVAQFEDRLDSERRRFSALASLNDEYCERIYNLEEQIKEQGVKFESIQEDCNRLKKVEAQIGALLVDAVLYSDKMTERAKTAATNITSDAKKNLVITAEDVSRLSLEIAQISGNFRDDITVLVEKVENLSTSLSSFASRFETECDLSEEKSYDGQEVFDHFISEYNKMQTVNNEDDNSESAESLQTAAKNEPVPEEDKTPDDEKNDDNEVHNYSDPFDSATEQQSSDKEAETQDDITESNSDFKDIIIDSLELHEPALSQTINESLEIDEPEITGYLADSDEKGIDPTFEIVTTEGIPINPDTVIEEFEDTDDLINSDADEDKAGVIVTLDNKTDDADEIISPDIDQGFSITETIDAMTEAVNNTPETIEPVNEIQTVQTDEEPEMETEPETETEPEMGTQLEQEQEDLRAEELSEEKNELIISQNRSRDISESDVDELLRLFSE